MAPLPVPNLVQLFTHLLRILCKNGHNSYQIRSPGHVSDVTSKRNSACLTSCYSYSSEPNVFILLDLDEAKRSYNLYLYLGFLYSWPQVRSISWTVNFLICWYYFDFDIYGYSGGENGIGKRHAHADCDELSNVGWMSAVRVTFCEEKWKTFWPFFSSSIS